MADTTSAEQVEDVREHVLRLARQIETLSQSDVPPPGFFERFLVLLVEALAAEGGAVWLLTGKNQIQLATSVRLDEVGLAGNAEAQRRNQKLLLDVLGTGEATAHRPGDASGQPGGETKLPVPYLTILGGLLVESECVGVVQIFQRADSPPEAHAGYLQFVEQMSGLASRYLERRRTARKAPPQSEFFRAFERFVLRLQQSRDLQEVARTAANDARLMLDADRVSVAWQRGRKTRIQAISGQDSVNPRANLVKRMVGMSRRVMAMREPVIYTGQNLNLAPQLEEALADYIQESGSRMVMFLPLLEPDPLLREDDDEHTRPNLDRRRKAPGCLIIDQINDSQPAPGMQPRAEMLAEHIAAALTNARAWQRIFLRGFWYRLGRLTEWLHGRKLIKTLLVLSLLTAIIAALWLVPWTYRVEGEGQLMPVEQREVFAPHDGDVVEMFVVGGQLVTEGQPLLRLRNDDLRTQILNTRNELNEKRQLVISIQAQVDEAANAGDQVEETKLEGQKVETLIEIEGLEKQLEILLEREKLLIVKSPLSGVIATFQVEQLLRNRPVRRGEVLMEVMDESGEWHLELQVPEHRMGHLLQAQQDQERTDLAVEFILATSSEETYEGYLGAISTRTVTDTETGSVVDVFAETDITRLPDRRIGAEVRAKIDCGQRSLGYVLFGDAIEFVRKRLWL